MHVKVRPGTIVAPVDHQRRRVTIIGLHFAPEPSGNAPYTTGLAVGLAARGFEVSVITGYPHYPEWRRRPGYDGWLVKDNQSGVKVTRLRHFIPRRPTGLARLHMELSFGVRVLCAKWDKPDVVILVSPALLSSAAAMCRIKAGVKRPPVAVWVQDLYSRGLVETNSAGGRMARLLQHLESRVMRSADNLVAIHARFKDHLVNELGVDRTRVHVIRNWTHLPPATASGRQAFRGKMGWKQDDFIVLHAGNMGMKQGLENVVEAARVALTRKSRVKFILMGDGHQRANLQAMGRGLPNLEFVDSLPGDEFEKALTAADALLVNELPGVRDMSVPSKLTSYFNAGLPVLAATDDGSVTAEEIRTSGGGIRVSPSDPVALVDAAERLRRDVPLAEGLGAKGLRYRLDTLGAETAMDRYDVLVTNLASSRD